MQNGETDLKISIFMSNSVPLTWPPLRVPSFLRVPFWFWPEREWPNGCFSSQRQRQRTRKMKEEGGIQKGPYIQYIPCPPPKKKKSREKIAKFTNHFCEFLGCGMICFLFVSAFLGGGVQIPIFGGGEGLDYQGNHFNRSGPPLLVWGIGNLDMASGTKQSALRGFPQEFEIRNSHIFIEMSRKNYAKK